MRGIITDFYFVSPDNGRQVSTNPHPHCILSLVSMLGLALLLLIALLALLFTPILPLRRRRTGVGSFPYVTVGLLSITIFVFVLQQNAPDLLADHWSLVPSHWQSSRIAQQTVTLLSYAFLHRDPLHLISNLITLYVIGVHVEEALGGPRFLLAYLSAAIMAGLAHMAITLIAFPQQADFPLLGASGAIFGILGLFAVRFWRTRVRLFWIPAVSASVAAGLVMLLQLILAIRSLTHGGTDEVAYTAHLAGFLYGVVLAFPLRVLEQSKREYVIEDAEAALAKGDLMTAARYYRELLVRSPQDGGLAHTLALICVRLGQEESAHRYFTEAIDTFSRQSNSPAVARVYSDALSCLPQVSLPSRLQLRVAGACEEVEQYVLAQEVLAGLCRDFPHTTDAELGLLKLGKLHLQRLGQRENATAIFTEFLRLYPKSEWANHVRGLLGEAK